MANTKSAEKRNRQALKKRADNRAAMSRLRTELKKVRKAVGAGETQQAVDLLPATLGLIDRTAKRGVIHDRNAARRKSRLTRLVQGAAASTADSA